MHPSLLCTPLLLVLAAACSSSGTHTRTQPAPARTRADPEAAEKQRAYGMPGPAHKVLDAKVGAWKGHVRRWTSPGAAPVEFDVTSEVRWILGGRFLEDITRGTSPSTPFEGRGTTGYDNLARTYQSMWVDDMSTGIGFDQGTWNAAHRTLIATGRMPDPAHDRFVATRSVETWSDDDHWTMEIYATGAGEDRKVVEIAYERVR